jgi:hypothetical protein
VDDRNAPAIACHGNNGCQALPRVRELLVNVTPFTLRQQGVAT